MLVHVSTHNVTFESTRFNSCLNSLMADLIAVNQAVYPWKAWTAYITAHIKTAKWHVLFRFTGCGCVGPVDGGE